MKSSIIISFLILLSFSVEAQTLDLESCLKMADTANLTIVNARLDIEMNKKQIKSVSLFYFRSYILECYFI
jgi:hypothetical protein